MSMELTKFGVIGAGAWGTALAYVLAQNHPRIMLWAHEPETAEHINSAHENKGFLPDIILPDAIHATSNLADIAICDGLLIVTPAQFTRAVLEKLADIYDPSKPLILCSKGVERDTLKLMSEVAAEFHAPQNLAVLSGPSFAADVARGLPTAVTLACADPKQGEALVHAMSLPGFRLYLSNDIIGAEIGGAMKNVLAIACGIVEGQQLGESARAALTARGFSEMLTLGQAMGARPETLGGLSGLGDLILTASSPTSRNFSLGVALGEGKTVAEIIGKRNSVSEGAFSAQAVAALAARHGLELPICTAIHHILSGDATVLEAINNLLARPLSWETGAPIETT